MELTEEALANMIEEAVAELDSWMPRDAWLSRVNLGVLDMGSGTRCVVGQVFGDWFDADPSVTDKIGFGNYEFNQMYGRGYYDYTTEASERQTVAYATLTAAWKAYLS